MRMIIVLDKICLLGIATASFYIGYHAGKKMTELNYSVGKSNH